MVVGHVVPSAVHGPLNPPGAATDTVLPSAALGPEFLPTTLAEEVLYQRICRQRRPVPDGRPYRSAELAQVVVRGLVRIQVMERTETKGLSRDDANGL